MGWEGRRTCWGITALGVLHTEPSLRLGALGRVRAPLSLNEPDP